MTNPLSSLGIAIGDITLKSAINWIASNITKITVMFGILWVIGKPFVDSYIVKAVADQKYVTEQALKEVISNLEKAANQIELIESQTKIITNQMTQQQFKVNEIDRRFDDLNNYQKELNRDIRVILRELRTISISPNRSINP